MKNLSIHDDCPYCIANSVFCFFLFFYFWVIFEKRKNVVSYSGLGDGRWIHSYCPVSERDRIISNFFQYKVFRIVCFLEGYSRMLAEYENWGKWARCSGSKASRLSSVMEKYKRQFIQYYFNKTLFQLRSENWYLSYFGYDQRTQQGTVYTQV